MLNRKTIDNRVNIVPIWAHAYTYIRSYSLLRNQSIIKWWFVRRHKLYYFNICENKTLKIFLYVSFIKISFKSVKPAPSIFSDCIACQNIGAFRLIGSSFSLYH